jgi:cell division septum initiation protein DivIVA
MHKFSTSFFGFDKSEVKSFIDEIDKVHDKFISDKKRDVDLLMSKIEETRNENNMLSQKIENLNSQRRKYVNYVDKEIENLKNIVNTRQEELDKYESLAIEKLTNKRDELVSTKKHLAGLKDELRSLSSKNQFFEKLYR